MKQQAPMIDGSDLVVVKNTVDEVIKQKVEQRAEMHHFEDDKNDAFFVGDLGDVLHKHKMWTSFLPRVKPFYAVKCNDDPTLLAVLATLGTGFDCASRGEIQKMLALNVSSPRIIYANPCKQASHIKYAAANGVEYMTFDNETELYKVQAYHPNAKMVIRILPPANTNCQCELGSKFGCLPRNVPHLLRVAKSLNVDVVGVSFHVGSGCYDAEAYVAAVRAAHEVFLMAEGEGLKFRLLDIGGGFPGQYDAPLSFKSICSVLRPALDEFFPASSGVELIAEPGRFYVASAFTLVLNVIARRAVKEDEASRHDSDGIVDVKPTVEGSHSFMYYLNDGVYGSFNCILYDHAVVVPELYDEPRYDGKPMYPSSLWGPTCDGLDCIVKNCSLPELETGDWVVFRNMGAYTMSAASSFNGMPKPHCYHVMHESKWLSLDQKVHKSKKADIGIEQRHDYSLNSSDDVALLLQQIQIEA